MQNELLILVAVLAFSANQLVTGIFQTKLQKSRQSINFYQAMFTLVAAAAYMQGVSFSLKLLLSAALFGICFAGATLFSAKCMEMGYMSLSSVIINLSLILPVMFSWVVMREAVQINAVIGLLLIIITLILSSLSTDTGRGGDFKKWAVFVAIAFFANGGSAIVPKQYKTSFGEEDLMMFMGFAYLVSSLIFSGTYLKKNMKNRIALKEQIDKIALLTPMAVVSGLDSFLGNWLLGYLCDKVYGGVLYPCLNGGLSILVAIASFAIFKEKLNRRKIIAIGTGVLAIILLNI